MKTRCLAWSLVLFMAGTGSIARADYLFTAQPYNGQVMQLWLGISPQSGPGTLQIDMSDPTHPGFSIAGSSGRHILRLGVNIDGNPAAPVLGQDGYLPPLVDGNPASYPVDFLDGVVTLTLTGATSQGGMLREDPAYDSYPQPQPGFPSAGWTTFLVDGVGLEGSFSVAISLPQIQGIHPQFALASVLTWNEPIEVDPVGLPEPSSLGLMGAGLLCCVGAAGRRRAYRRLGK